MGSEERTPGKPFHSQSFFRRFYEILMETSITSQLQNAVRLPPDIWWCDNGKVNDYKWILVTAINNIQTTFPHSDLFAAVGDQQLLEVGRHLRAAVKSNSCEQVQSQPFGGPDFDLPLAAHPFGGEFTREFHEGNLFPTSALTCVTSLQLLWKLRNVSLM